MKVLFLDIDGVVNCKTTSQRHRGYIGIDPYLAFLVGKITLDVSDLNVVLSSSWRTFHDDGMEEISKQVCPLFDITPVLGRPAGTGIEYCERGREIKAWLELHPNVEKYAIVDDENDMLPEQQQHFFKTSWDTGITPEIAAAITAHLL